MSARSSPPRYQQIVEEIRRDIARSLLVPGDALPSEAELCDRFSVGRHTVREAIRLLREEGVVESRQGAATRVARAERPLYTYSVGDVAELLQYATEARYAIDKTSIVTADPALASRLTCPPGSRWLRVEGFRYTKEDTSPLCWTEVYILSEYSGVGVQIGRQTGTIFSFIENMYGVRIEQIDQSLYTCAMPEPARAAMDADPVDQATVIRRIYRLHDGSIALIAVNFHSPMRLRLNWTLHRAAS